MRRRHAALAASALVLVAALGACGSSDSSSVATEPAETSAPGNVLTFTDAHHHSYAIVPHSLKCAVGDYGQGVKTLQIQQVDRAQRAILVVQVVPVSRPTTYSLPLDGGDMQRGRRNAFLFLGSSHELEVSTVEELQHPSRDGGGELRVLEASCDPVRLRMTIHGTLGSEYNAGELKVSGGIDLSGS